MTVLAYPRVVGENGKSGRCHVEKCQLSKVNCSQWDDVKHDDIYDIYVPWVLKPADTVMSCVSAALSWSSSAPLSRDHHDVTGDAQARRAWLPWWLSVAEPARVDDDDLTTSLIHTNDERLFTSRSDQLRSACMRRTTSPWRSLFRWYESTEAFSTHFRLKLWSRKLLSGQSPKVNVLLMMTFEMLTVDIQSSSGVRQFPIELLWPGIQLRIYNTDFIIIRHTVCRITRSVPRPLVTHAVCTIQ